MMVSSMKLSLVLIVACISVCVSSTTRPSTSSSVSSYDAGCYAVYRSRTGLFQRFFRPNLQVPTCVEGGLWRHFQCIVGSTLRCVCVYVDTGSIIPVYAPHKTHLVFQNPYYANVICPIRTQKASSSNDSCHNPPLSYPCKLREVKYTYNDETQQCEETVGCYGFKNRSDCQSRCNVRAPEIQVYDSCNLPLDNGYSCQNKDEEIRYRHDETSGQCQSFSYRGCGGNSNNYATMWECERTCVPQLNVSVIVRVGNERTYNLTVPQWVVDRFGLLNETNDISQDVFEEIEPYISNVEIIYDETDDGSRSLTFINHVNSEPEEAFLRRVMGRVAVCVKPPKTDPCRAYFPRCDDELQGNQCAGCDDPGIEHKISFSKDINVTTQLPDWLQRINNSVWYYDSERQKCFKFVYGGCQPNGNNFQTADECSSFCRAAYTPSPRELVAYPTDSDGNTLTGLINGQRCEKNARGELICAFPGSTTTVATIIESSADNEEEDY